MNHPDDIRSPFSTASVVTWGIALKGAVGKTFLDLRFPEELAAKLQRQIQHVFESGEIVRDEVSLQAAKATQLNIQLDEHLRDP